MPDAQPAGERVTEVLVGANAWRHAEWIGGFYPEDLPEEWALAYYANEFRTVLVPEDQWQAAASEVLIQWYDDTHEHFRFLLELAGTSPPVDRLAGVQRTLRERFGGLVLRARPETTPRQMNHLLRDLQTVLGSKTLVVDARHAATGIEDVIRAHGVQRARTVDADTGDWEPAMDGSNRGHVSFDVGLVPSDSRKIWELRRLRELVERACRRIPPAEQTALIFEGKSPAIEDLRNARTIAELLGC